MLIFAYIKKNFLNRRTKDIAIKGLFVGRRYPELLQSHSQIKELTIFPSFADKISYLSLCLFALISDISQDNNYCLGNNVCTPVSSSCLPFFLSNIHKLKPFSNRSRQKPQNAACYNPSSRPRSYIWSYMALTRQLCRRVPSTSAV